MITRKVILGVFDVRRFLVSTQFCQVTDETHLIQKRLCLGRLLPAACTPVLEQLPERLYISRC